MPWRIHMKATVKHIETIGLNSLPIVGLLNFLIGVVVAFMGAVQLKKFGAEIFTVNLVGIAILRELGVLITAILIAGRSGSAFTAQIGTMKVNQEIDAMRTIGLNPVEVLVLPRILAMIVVMPLLTFYADIMGICGGAVMSMAALDISLESFIRQLQSAIDLKTFMIGILKAPVCAYIIALVGCFEGMQVSGSAESVGTRTTMSVVEAIFLVIVFDAIVAITLSYLDI
jgi:phospholipid/cholesterol/gamma-HCH transport system permease protein